MDGIAVTSVTRERVRHAFARASRSAFLPDTVRHLAGSDRPVMIGHDATCSQPSTVARMLELLDVQPGDRVLDVGAGSGWTCALLVALAGDDGQVVGVERVEELVAFATDNLRSVGLATEVVHATPGTLGLPSRAPFDRILVSADLGRRPHELVAQLADGGRLVAPVADVMTVVDLRSDEPTVREDAGRYAFVPLVE